MSPPCQKQELLYQNDLMQAKILITSSTDPDGLALAGALLERIQKENTRGELELYRGLLLIRRHPDDINPALPHLERAAQQQHPHAIALLYKIYKEPYLLTQADSEKAESYRQQYANLDVARSGYPSFAQAQNIVSHLFAMPLQPQQTPSKPSTVTPPLTQPNTPPPQSQANTPVTSRKPAPVRHKKTLLPKKTHTPTTAVKPSTQSPSP